MIFLFSDDSFPFLYCKKYNIQVRKKLTLNMLKIETLRVSNWKIIVHVAICYKWTFRLQTLSLSLLNIHTVDNIHPLYRVKQRPFFLKAIVLHLYILSVVKSLVSFRTVLPLLDNFVFKCNAIDEICVVLMVLN